MFRRLSSLVVVLVLVLVLVTGSDSYSASGPHIADVNILLPPKMTHPVEYRLQGSDGCFKWSWDHHDILSVLPEYNTSSHCSTSARLKSIAPYSGRKETAVYATDVYTGVVIRCKVYIDNFSRIQIFHNSVKLDLDGLATLRVRAFDNEENVFSSLVGLQFVWQLMPETDSLLHHLIHVPLKDSPLSDCGGLFGDLDIQIRLEESGVFSDMYVVKGTAIGHEIVSVHLREPQLEHMADKIVLTVAEAISLDPPSPVFVLVGASVQYRLKVIRGNVPQVVNLPSPFHRWSVLNSSVVQVDGKMGLTSALSLGSTIVTVEDNRVAGHLQMSSVHVVVPDTLRLYIIPLSLSGDPVEGLQPISSMSGWYVVSGRQYLIQLKVFSQGPGAQEIYITERDDVALHGNHSEYWNIFPVSDGIAANHGWNSRILEATKCGQGKLSATVTYSSGSHDTKEVLHVVHEVLVCDQVMFSMDKISGESKSILLPWAPGVYQELELKAIGGCAKTSSDYKWFSSDMATVSISASGLVQAKKPGKVTVKVVSIFDQFNYDEVDIEVSTPTSMVMLPIFSVETAVGSHLRGAVTMTASNGAYFYRCDAFSSSVRWKAGSESFIIVNSTGEAFVLDNGYGPSCSWISAYASSSGRTTLHATFSKEYKHFDHSFTGPITLKASWHVSAYLPLVVHQVGDGNQFGGYWFDLAQAEAHKQMEHVDELYLAPGTHLDVMLYGGPEQWDQGVDYIETVETLDEERTRIKDGVLVHQPSINHGNSYRIFCPSLGTFRLLFKRGNLVGIDHPLPAIEEVELSLKCNTPSSIVLLADEPVNSPAVISTATQAGRSSGGIRATPVTVANGRTIRLSAVGISNSGKAFGNSSSLSLKWELSNCDGLAFWHSYDIAKFRASWERFLVLQNASGLCIVRATVTKFPGIMSILHSTTSLKSSESVLTDAISLQLVSSLRVDPEFSLLFFSSDAQLNLSITGGSSFVDAMVNNSHVVEVIQPQSGLQCSQLVLVPKELGTAVVTVYDIGVSPQLAASSVVQVADVDWIKITTGEEISLMEGSVQSIELLAGISSGLFFDSSQYAYMNIRVHIEDHIIELIDSDDLGSPIDGYLKAPKFMIRTKYLGVTTLYVSARQQSGLEILSQPIKVEVYAPPKINPSEIFLVPGASYVLTLRGGPTLGAYIEYTSMDDGTATVHGSSGRLSAVSPGNTSLVATVYGSGDTIICQAYGRVKVGVPSSAILNIQSDQLAVGRKMSIFPSFSEGNLFSFYELCNNYNWNIEDEKVLSFQIAKHLYGNEYKLTFAGEKEIKSSSTLDQKDLGFIEVLYARSTGRTNVALSFSCDFISPGSFSQSSSYHASVSLSVVSDLPLALGTPITWFLPPHYTTTSLLPSSSSSRGKWDTKSRKGMITYSLLRECGGKNEEVQQDAISIDGDRIKTMEPNNLACIQAKDRSTGRVEVASCVRVAEVAQIRIANKEFPFHIVNLAVDAKLHLEIKYCDIQGNPFHEAYNVILFHTETNYPDIVSVKDTRDGNGSIHLKALRHGTALVRISFNNNPQKSDYILVMVGAQLYPQNPVLHVGSHLNFSMEGVNGQVRGRWLSGNESVISINMLSGKAEAIAEGTTQVIFEASGLALQTAVSVLKGTSVFVDAPKETLINVPYPAKGYRFTVKFSQQYQAAVNDPVLYDCKVKPSYIGYATPWRDSDTSVSYCIFFPYSPEQLARPIPRSQYMGQEVSVSISAFLREANHVSGSASAFFIGGFSVFGMDKLNLTPSFNKSIISIVGNTDVEVHSRDRDKLMIGFLHKIGGLAQYQIEALGAQRIEDKVIITLPVTGQRVEIDVSYEPFEIEASTTRANAAKWGGIFGCIALFALSVAVLVYFLDKPDRSPTSIPSTARSVVTAVPVTPERSSSASGVLNEKSPRTPQPFVEYLRRTIDETPNYRREGRRFNPQNTY